MKSFIAICALALGCSTAHASQSAGNPRLNFLLYCAGCHAVNGSGHPQNGIPDFRNRLGHYLKIPGGRAYVIRVPGTAQSPLSDGDTAELLNWMMGQFNSVQTLAAYAPITVEEVNTLRRIPLADIPGYRRDVTERLYQSHGVDLRDYRLSSDEK